MEIGYDGRAMVNKGFCEVHWNIEADIADGHLIYVTGDPDTLGCWKPEKAVVLSPSTEHTNLWRIQIQTAKDLIREIAVLELEVIYLEQHLLCLYRKAFDPQISTPTGDKSKRVPSSQSVLPQSVSTKKSLPHKSFTRVNESPVFGSPEKLTGPGVHRSQSDLSHRTVCSARISPSAGSIARAFQSCHSQPLSFLRMRMILARGWRV